MNREHALRLVENHISITSVIMKTNLRHIHIALLMKRGKIIGIASNFLGSRIGGCGYDEHSIHAERALIKKVGYRNLMGATMVVIRVSRVLRVLGESKPCMTCTPHLNKCMKEYGLKRVYYTAE